MATTVLTLTKTLPGFGKYLSLEKKTNSFLKGDIQKKLEILNNFIAPSQKISFSKKDGNPYFEIETGNGKTIKLFCLSEKITLHFLHACEKLKAA